MPAGIQQPSLPRIKAEPLSKGQRQKERQSSLIGELNCHTEETWCDVAILVAPVIQEPSQNIDLCEFGQPCNDDDVNHLQDFGRQLRWAIAVGVRPIFLQDCPLAWP